MIDLDEIDNKNVKDKITNEIKILESRVRLAAELNDASIDQIIAIDAEENLIACNHACGQLWNADKDAVLGVKLATAFPELYNCTDIEKAIAGALEGYKYFVSASQADYGKGHFEHHFVPLKDAGGNVTGVLIVIHDVAHRVKAEQELKQLELHKQ